MALKRYLLDTSAYSAFKRGHSELTEMLESAEEVLLSAVTIGELLAGFSRGSRARENERELAEFLSLAGVGIVDITEATAERYASVWNYLRSAGSPIPTNDIWIAASAMEHGLALLTIDEHFRKLPQVVTRLLDI